MPSVGAGLFSVGLASAGGVGTRVGAAFVEVFADTSGVTRGFAATEAQLKTFAGRMQSTGAMLAPVGAKMTRYISVPLIAAAGVAVKFAADFDQAMARTSALAGIAQKDVAGFRREILALSGETAVAPEELANTLYFVGSAGLKASEVLPVLQLSAKAAAAEMTDAATAGHLLSGVLVAYDDQAPTAAQAMDVLTAAIRGGKAEPADLANNLGTVLPVAAAASVSFDEVAGAIAAMTNVNIDAARGATGLRYMLSQMNNPTEAAKSALDDYGLSIGDVQKAVATDLVGGLKMLADTFDLTTVKGKEAFNTVIGGVRSSHAAYALIGENFARTSKIMDATAKAAGDTGNEFEDAYQKMTETDAFAFRKAWNDLKLAAIDAGEAILPIARTIVDAIGSVFSGFANLNSGAQQFIVYLAGVAAAAGPVIAVLSRLWGFAGKIGSVFATIGGKVAGAAAPEAALAGGGQAAGAALVASATEAAGILIAGGEGAGAAMVAGARGSSAAGMVSGITPPPNFFGKGATGQFSSVAGSIDDVGAAAARSSDEVVGLGGSLGTAGKTAGKAFSSFGLMAKGLGEMGLVTGAAIAAGGLLSKAWDSATKSNEDLALQTGLSLDQIDAVRDAVEDSAATFNVFSSSQDKAAEAGQIYSEVLQEAVDAGMNMGAAQARLNHEFSFAVEKIGGLTGSMPAFRQQLESTLGLASSPEAQDFKEFVNSLDSEVDVGTGAAPTDALSQAAVTVPIRPEVDDAELTAIQAQFAEAMTGFTAETLPSDMQTQWQEAGDAVAGFVEHVNGAIEGGAKMSEVVDILTQGMQQGRITTEIYDGIMSALGEDLPYDELGMFGDAIREVGGATTKQRDHLAGLLGTIQDGHIPFSNMSKDILATLIQQKNWGAAIEQLDGIIRGHVDNTLDEMGKKIGANARKMIEASMKAGNFKKALEVLNTALRKIDSKHEARVSVKGAKEAKEEAEDFYRSLKKIKGEKDVDLAVRQHGAEETADRFSTVDGRLKGMGDTAKSTARDLKNLETTQKNLAQGKAIDIAVRHSAIDSALSKSRSLKGAVQDLDSAKAQPTVKVNDQASGPLRNIKGLLDGIQSKTVTVTVNTVKSGPQVIHEGGTVGTSTMRHYASRKAHEVDTRLRLGEFVVNRASAQKNAGLLRAINDNDAAGVMREIAKRGGGRGGAKVVAGAQVNVNLTVNGNQDPRTIATMVGAEIARKVGAETGGYGFG